MRLCDCAAGKLYMIRTVTAEETIVRRLEALGLVEGTKVHILMKKQDGSLIAAFQGTRLALDGLLYRKSQLWKDHAF